MFGGPLNKAVANIFGLPVFQEDFKRFGQKSLFPTFCIQDSENVNAC